jgi:hypothetical protein
MKSLKTIAVSIFVLICTFLLLTHSEASGIDMGNFTVTVPDSIEVTGLEVGTGSRYCTFTASMDAKPGSVIPLRGGVVISLIDSLNTSIDNGYSLAEVEGLTHLDIKGVFHCAASNGTLKPPYKFSITPRGIPNSQVFGYESPVTLKFVQNAPTPTPSATPKPSPTPTPSASSSSLASVELIEANTLIQSLKTENDSLKNRLLLANSSLKILNSRIAKICGNKPKPKGC